MLDFPFLGARNHLYGRTVAASLLGSQNDRREETADQRLLSVVIAETRLL